MTRICMLVTSELDRDPRVQKEAASAYEAGHEVTVVCRTYAGPPMRYRVRPLGIGRRKTRLGKYLERICTNLAFACVAAQIKPEIIHANDLDTLPSAYVASRLTGARLLYDAHELWASAGRDVGTSALQLALSMERFLCHRADAVVAVSELRSQRMAELLGIPKPLVVMNTPPHVPFADLAPGDWVRQFAGRKIVLHQGRYVANRGILEAILAARYLPDDVVVVLRGYGPIENQLRSRTIEEGLSERVVFLPPVPMVDLVSSAVGADLGLVLYMPINENNLYAAPNKMFEYMMAGVPSVSSDIPYAREVLVENGLGVVFTPGDPRDMARVISELLADRDRLAIMKKNCIGKARQFSWEVEVRKLLDEYDRIASTQG